MLLLTPQDNCRSEGEPPILPLTGDLDVARYKIKTLDADSLNTYSALGMAWGARLLAPAWRDIWGDPVHPMPSTEARPVQKILVLLTDGEDNYLGRDPEFKATMKAERKTACEQAKAAGIKVFVITAMHPSHLSSDFAASLIECSSQGDDPDGEYVFFNNATPENLEAAFRSIGRQLLVMRRVH